MNVIFFHTISYFGLLSLLFSSNVWGRRRVILIFSKLLLNSYDLKAVEHFEIWIVSNLFTSIRITFIKDVENNKPVFWMIKCLLTLYFKFHKCN